ncbi:SPOR domain-containing protein [Qipengyuania sp. MTN3-11]|uniref:SPOR domain-containing protein n=1 Tax=Qipengyuania sp. MTN3-11 TaxID=3056557 RepID=UPI0036F2133A
MVFPPPSLRLKPGLVVLGAALVMPAMAGPAAAQREIVQPLPPAEADDLNEALRRLSANPVDLDALLQAGAASLVLRDVAAAEGFYARALAVAPANGFAKLGMARVRLEARDPVAALRLFDEAEQAGVPAGLIAADRAFAYDLVGDQARAQSAYRTALAAGEDAEVRRRLALSLAISRQRDAFEDTIFPLLDAQDRAAFRTRAFGLAILGDEGEAIEIAETMLPTDLALRMAPYLRYMPRLTAAQQAAAANLGVFPRASDIGRDDAAIAAYAAQGQRIARVADASLTPTGQTLGQNRNPASAPASRQTERAEPRRRPDQQDRTAGAGPGRAGPGQRAIALPEIDTAVAQQPPTETASPVLVASAPTASGPTLAPTPAPSSAAATGNPPAIALATGERTEPTPAETRIATIDPTPEPPVSPQPVMPPQSPPARVADAFADFDLASTTTQVSPRVPDAVDITAITPPREIEREEPAPPAHPARHWVQVATGKDLAALKFDWRRIARGAGGELDGKGPFTAPWGEANRLLAGPYPSASAAREKVNELKALGLDTFPFSSAAGEAVAALD